MGLERREEGTSWHTVAHYALKARTIAAEPNPGAPNVSLPSLIKPVRLGLRGPPQPPVSFLISCDTNSWPHFHFNRMAPPRMPGQPCAQRRAACFC